MDADRRKAEAGPGPLPDFLIAGATRCGTSSLYHYLSAHPGIYMSPLKEVNFFCRDRQYQKGLRAYRRNFCDAAKGCAVGEASPMYWVRGIRRDRNGDHVYSLIDDAGIRIAKELPRIKTIISLRDPVRRAYSQFWRNYCRGRETTSSFLEAISEEVHGIRKPEETNLCWVYHNAYSFHLSRWLELFPREQVKVIVFEDWTESPAETYVELCEFLGVDSTFVPSDFERQNAGWKPRSQFWADRISPWLSKVPVVRRLDNWNRSVGYRELSRDEYLSVRQVFAVGISELETMLQRKLDVWQFHEKPTGICT